MKNDVKYITLDMSCTTIQSREPYSDDEWDRGDTDSEWTFGSATLEDKQHYNSFPESGFKKGDTCYIVVCIWSTGCTFGHDERACAEIFGVFHTETEASEFETKLRVETGYHLPWNGYFEYLEEIYILKEVLN